MRTGGAGGLEPVGAAGYRDHVGANRGADLDRGQTGPARRAEPSTTSVSPGRSRARCVSARCEVP